MLFYIYNKFAGSLHFVNILHYISFRSIIAFLMSFIISIAVFPWFINMMKRVSNIQPIRDFGPDHLYKTGTPTMGGLVIVTSIIISILITGNLSNHFVWSIMFVLIAFAILGFADDYLKIAKKNSKGVPGKAKLLIQFVVSFVAIYVIDMDSDLWYQDFLLFPIFKNFILDIGFFYTIFRAIVISGSSNGINLTDGLDGLVTMPIIISAACLGVFAYIIGSGNYAEYLFFRPIKGAAELVVPCAALIGACFGFLWYNIKPAQIFMGDVGSLSLGGFLGTLAVIIKCEILFAMIGGLFVIESLSVILQVYYFRFTGGNRLFKMAPIHHHFEKSGWSEMQVVVRFWIIALLFGIAGLMTLKIR